MQGPEVLIPLTIFAGGFAMIFGIVYLKTKENLAMVEKGMNPKDKMHRPAPYRNLKWGLLLIGSGIGLLLAYLVNAYLTKDDNPALWFALLAIGGGLGLIGSYSIEKKQLLDRREDNEVRKFDE